jgi:hypothetical protein
VERQAKTYPDPAPLLVIGSFSGEMRRGLPQVSLLDEALIGVKKVQGPAVVILLVVTHEGRTTSRTD